MNTNEDKNRTATDTTDNLNPPFVNEECGDTMWDAVLKESEERLSEIITRKPDENPSELLRHKSD